MQESDNPAIVRATEAIERDIRQVKIDPTRPVYHFRPAAGYHNDPNGLIQHNGIYHLFYQFHPFTQGRGKGEEIFWGHARSRDLLHWEHLPIAIWPSTELGERRCASGATLIGPDRRPIIFYTSMSDGTSKDEAPDQWAASGDADLICWRKHPDNPVLTSALHGDVRISNWRDPFLFVEQQVHYMLIGGSVLRAGGDRGCVAIYRAENTSLTQWRYLNVLYEWPDPDTTSLECPNLFRFGDRWLLFFSHHPPATQVACMIGTFDQETYTFNPNFADDLEYSPMGMYAPQGLRDDQDRVIAFGWVRGAGWYPDGGRGWSGCMTLPRVLSLRPDGRLAQEPAPEVAELRGEHHAVGSGSFDHTTRSVEGVGGDCLEIIAEFEAGDADSYGLIVRRSDDGERGVVIRYDGECMHLTGADPSGIFAGSNPPSAGGDYATPFVLLESENSLRLHLFVDKCVLELYVNNRACFTRTIYSNLDDLGVAVFAEQGRAKLKRLDIWEMDPVW